MSVAMIEAIFSGLYPRSCGLPEKPKPGNEIATTVYRVAHSLKSSSAMVGALRLSALCKTLEGRAREALEGPVPDGADEIETEYARVVEALGKIGAGGGS